MAVLDLFSKRQKRSRGEVPDVYVYDDLPNQLRVQIVHIIRDTFGNNYFGGHSVQNIYSDIHAILCREYGVFQLNSHSNGYANEVLNFFLNEESNERALDVVEICFTIIHSNIDETTNIDKNHYSSTKSHDAISELNARFKEHGIGYQFESKEIIRVDSELLHAEVVKPTLALLRDQKFNGANEEFLSAHEHYRHGRHKECLVESLKAFESTMKTICELHGWQTKPKDTAKNLINICLDNGLIPSYMESL